MNNQETSSQISSLNKERIEIQKKKVEFVKSQKYEEAARIRDTEKKVISEILMLISARFGVDFVSETSLKTDILNVLDLACNDEIELIETITDTYRSTLKRDSIERLLLVRKIELYKKGELAIEDINTAIQNAFLSIKHDIKNQINNLF